MSEIANRKEVYLKAFQISKTEPFEKIVKCLFSGKVHLRCSTVF